MGHLGRLAPHCCGLTGFGVLAKQPERPAAPRALWKLWDRRSADAALRARLACEPLESGWESLGRAAIPEHSPEEKPRRREKWPAPGTPFLWQPPGVIGSGAPSSDPGEAAPSLSPGALCSLGSRCRLPPVYGRPGAIDPGPRTALSSARRIWSARRTRSPGGSLNAGSKRDSPGGPEGQRGASQWAPLPVGARGPEEACALRGDADPRPRSFPNPSPPLPPPVSSTSRQACARHEPALLLRARPAGLAPSSRPGLPAGGVCAQRAVLGPVLVRGSLWARSVQEPDPAGMVRGWSQTCPGADRHGDSVCREPPCPR